VVNAILFFSPAKERFLHLGKILTASAAGEK